MAESAQAERTEDPTPQRLAQARRRGEVVKSRDLGGAAVLAVLFGALALGAPAAVSRLTRYIGAAIEAAPRGGQSAEALGWAVRESAAALLLPVALATVTTLLVGVVQTGGLLSFEPLRFDATRVLPSAQRVVSAAAAMEMAKGLVKVAVVTAIVWLTLEPMMRGLAALPGVPGRRVIVAVGTICDRLGLRLVLAAAAFGAADYLWQRRQLWRQLRMTRDEVKREHKESEGDPHHKAERQRLHRELAQQRMLADVRKADFVVVNPDHIAVALRYDRDGHAAPMVVAKGERLLAEKIKEEARAAGVPIFRDVALARSLWDVEAGDEIPDALYEAVAEILRVVYGASAVAGSGTGR